MNTKCGLPGWRGATGSYSRAVSVRGPTVTANAGAIGRSSVRSRTAAYSGMITVTGMPDAAWYFARLATASPSPPVRANGDSSGTRCTTGAGVPSGRVRGAVGIPSTGVGGGTSFLREARFGRSVVADAFFARGLRRVAGVVTSDEPSSDALGVPGVIGALAE